MPARAAGLIAPQVGISARPHRVTLENPDGPAIQDGEGGFTQPYKAVSPPATVWCSIAPATLRDLERVVAGTVQSSATHIVTMLYHPDVNTGTRLLFKSRTLHVTGVQNREERNIELILICQEVVA